ncbi:hypothetical protein MGSAQ_002841 [marine sediment metagenome]|uniref:Uncharacterized protein n=1 Tax=marine sediment metagenome TaxID=412755 RepID=A0A1B6NRV5_9ZZZZ
MVTFFISLNFNIGIFFKCIFFCEMVDHYRVVDNQFHWVQWVNRLCIAT